MKCPYRTKIIHKAEHKAGYMKYFAEDITEFCSCVKFDCPFYYYTPSFDLGAIVEHCRKAESEVK